MGTYVTSELKKIFVEDVQGGASVSESVQNKMGATINYIVDNATFTERFNNAQVFTSSGTFTVPAGVNKIKVTCVGGGGGGSGNEYSGYVSITSPYPQASFTGGMSGAAGGQSVGVYSVTPSTGYTVTIGAGGAGGTVYNAGSAGGTSSFHTFCSATGGSGGALSSSSYSSQLTNYKKGLGSGGNITNIYGNHIGNDGIYINGATGANISPTYGGGGAGAITVNGDSGAGLSGQNGADGVVIVEWNAP